MGIKVNKTELPGVLVVEIEFFGDDRGFFVELYNQQKYREAGLVADFVQDNCSYSVKGTLRGLHYQLTHPQAKLVSVLQGSVYDVVVDIRHGSPTFGKWIGLELSRENRRQIYIPEGYAHGFCVTSELASVVYKCTDFYSPKDEQGVLWSDPRLNIAWPTKTPLLSAKDQRYACLSDMPIDLLPRV